MHGFDHNLPRNNGKPPLKNELCYKGQTRRNATQGSHSIWKHQDFGSFHEGNNKEEILYLELWNEMEKLSDQLNI